MHDRQSTFRVIVKGHKGMELINAMSDIQRKSLIRSTFEMVQRVQDSPGGQELLDRITAERHARLNVERKPNA